MYLDRLFVQLMFSEASTLIDLNDLVNGTYFIQVEMSGAVMVKRFVLNR